MIKLSQVREGEHQYSCLCGWIDNAHASMGDSDDDIRLDVGENWKQFPPGVNSRRSPGNQGWLLNYRQPVGLMSNVAKLTFPTQWFIRDLKGDRDAYRGVALRLYQRGNEHLEALQAATDFIKQSSFSYEDLSSNLIAWYRGVMGFTRARVKEVCQVISAADSLALAQAINIDQIHEKNREWGKALLFNDRCEACKGRGAKASGWADMPAEFATVRPGAVTLTPGTGDAWPPELDPLLRSHPYDKNHLPWWDRPPATHASVANPHALSDQYAGLSGHGRRPGPLDHG